MKWRYSLLHQAFVNTVNFIKLRILSGKDVLSGDNSCLVILSILLLLFWLFVINLHLLFSLGLGLSLGCWREGGKDLALALGLTAVVDGLCKGGLEVEGVAVLICVGVHGLVDADLGAVLKNLK